MPRVHIPLSSGEVAQPASHAAVPLARVLVAVGVSADSAAMSTTVLEVSFVVVAIGGAKDAKAVEDIGFEESLYIRTYLI